MSTDSDSFDQGEIDIGYPTVSGEGVRQGGQSLTWSKESGYTEEVGRYIVDQVTCGYNLEDIAEYLGIAKSTISMWAARQKPLDESLFKTQLEEAKVARAHLMAESMLREAAALPNEVKEMAQDGKSHKIANAYVNAKSRKFATQQWMMERLVPDVYGTKVQHGGKIDHGIEVRVINYGDVVDGTVIDGRISRDVEASVEGVDRGHGDDARLLGNLSGERFDD